VAADKKSAALLLTNSRGGSHRKVRITLNNLPWKEASRVEVFVADAARDF